MVQSSYLEESCGVDCNSKCFRGLPVKWTQNGCVVIPLTQGQETVIDTDTLYLPLKDGTLVSDHLWSMMAAHPGSRYAATSSNECSVKLHRVILNYPKDLSDHRDGDGLNNRRSNLRACSSSENSMNRKSRTGSSSEYKNVSYHKVRKIWRSHIRFYGVPIDMGAFLLEHHAAYASDVAGGYLHGSFAILNKPEDNDGYISDQDKKSLYFIVMCTITRCFERHPQLGFK